MKHSWNCYPIYHRGAMAVVNISNDWNVFGHRRTQLSPAMTIFASSYGKAIHNLVRDPWLRLEFPV